MGGGAVSRSYARGMQAGLLAIVIPAYSMLANRIEPARLVKWIMASFVIALGLFFLLGRASVALGFAFFVWLGIFSTLSIAQFWSLANDVMTEAEGRRLFPMIAVGGTVGGIVGAQIAARTMAVMTPYQLMLLAAGLLVGCMALTHATHAMGERHRTRVPALSDREARDRRGGFTLVLRDRYLTLIALSVFVLNMVNTTGDFILAQMVSAKAQALTGEARRAFIGEFYGDFQTWVSSLTALVQILVVGRVFKTIGVGRALFFLPVIAVAGYGASALLPALALVAVVKVVENSTDYSLQNTIQQALFLPTSRDAKYKAKSAIDTVLVRLGDLASTGLVFVGVHAGLRVLGFAVVNVVLGVAWVGIALMLRRRQEALGARAVAPAPSRPVPAAVPVVELHQANG
jgi:AAA family ATP:ADP antiporter